MSRRLVALLPLVILVLMPALTTPGSDVLPVSVLTDAPLVHNHEDSHHHGATAGPSGQAPACDKDIDTSSTIAGVAFVAAQDNINCGTGDLDLYWQNGELYVAQSGRTEMAFTITRIAADGTPTMITQKSWGIPNTYTADVAAFKQGSRRYLALALERFAIGAACGVMIVDVTDAPVTTTVHQASGAGWCDVHNAVVENDANGDGRYIYLTADWVDMRVLDIGNLSAVTEIGRYTHPSGGQSNIFVHDVTVIDHGGAIGRRVYVSYWGAGVMILDAADVTPGVIDSNSANQPLNPNYSIDPANFRTHHAYPTADGTRVFIEDEFFTAAGEEPVQMWDISNPAAPSYVDGIALGSSLLPTLNPVHNLDVIGSRLYLGGYKLGLQAFDFTSAGFTDRPIYHQVQTEASDGAYTGAWGTRLATIGGTTYVFQSDMLYGLIISEILDSDSDGVFDVDDNCPAWANPSQALPVWAVPAGDADCDGVNATKEAFMGTDPLDNCADTTTENDEQGPAAGEPLSPWPSDINDNGRVTLADVIRFGPHFNSPPNPGYDARFDNNTDGRISLADIILMTPYFNKSCMP